MYFKLQLQKQCANIIKMKTNVFICRLDKFTNHFKLKKKKNMPIPPIRIFCISELLQSTSVRL